MLTRRNIFNHPVEVQLHGYMDVAFVFFHSVCIEGAENGHFGIEQQVGEPAGWVNQPFTLKPFVGLQRDGWEQQCCS